jgi:hypothetical protein
MALDARDWVYRNALRHSFLTFQTG